MQLKTPLLIYIVLLMILGFSDSRKFKVTYGILNCYNANDYKESIMAGSFLQCAIICRRLQGHCSLAYYTVSTKICRLYLWDNIIGLKINKDPFAIMDTIVLIPKRTSQFGLLHVSYTTGTNTTPFSEAGTVCLRVGAHVATESELGQSLTQVPDLCSCGWIADGRAIYWLASQTNGCDYLKYVCGQAPDDQFSTNCIVSSP